jgi:acetolactate synthase-1/2/3 large subunit
VARRRSELFAEIIDKAFLLAESGQPGRCWSTCRWTCFRQKSTRTSSRGSTTTPRATQASLDIQTAREIVRRMAEARQPLIYAGGGIVWRRLGRAARVRRSPRHSVAHSLMGKGALPDDHPCCSA